ncbi:hypothetical protein PF002_g30983, partial [Phytophthora fragariae]
APKVIRSPEAVVVYQTLAAAQLFQPQRILAASKQRQLASASPPLSFLRLAMEASAIKDNDGVRRPAMIYPVPGRFDVPSRESELTVELRRAVEAIKMPETPLQETNEMDVSLAGSHEDNLASSTRLPTLADRNKRHHRGKDRLGVRKVSRKRGHQKQRKPSRCSHA